MSGRISPFVKTPFSPPFTKNQERRFQRGAGGRFLEERRGM
jgi:hypothetical protein